MNPNTRELITNAELLKRFNMDRSSVKDFIPVPEEHEELAQKELDGYSSVVLPKKHPITVAVKEIDKKAKRKAAKESKRKNRR